MISVGNGESDQPYLILLVRKRERLPLVLGALHRHRLRMDQERLSVCDRSQLLLATNQSAVDSSQLDRLAVSIETGDQHLVQRLLVDQLRWLEESDLDLRTCSWL